MKRLSSKNESRLLLAAMILVAGTSTVDLIMDWGYATPAHVLTETLLTIASLTVCLLALKRTLRSQTRFQQLLNWSKKLEESATQWKAEAEAYNQGLSAVIEKEFRTWKLSPAESEVAWLLFKGLSQKEIAGIRGTNEATIRTQCLSIYSKAGISGRTELAAYFLEDFLSIAQPSAAKPLKRGAPASNLSRKDLHSSVETIQLSH